MCLLLYCTVSHRPPVEYLQREEAVNSNCGEFDPRGHNPHGVSDPLLSMLQWPKQAARIHLEVPDPETHWFAGELRFQIHATMCPMVMGNNASLQVALLWPDAERSRKTNFWCQMMACNLELQLVCRMVLGTHLHWRMFQPISLALRTTRTLLMPKPFAPPRLALPVVVMRIATAAPLQHTVVVLLRLAVATRTVAGSAPQIRPGSVNQMVAPAVGDTGAVFPQQTAAAAAHRMPAVLLDIGVVQGKAAVRIEVANAVPVSASTNEASRALGEVHQMTHLWQSSDRTPLLHLCVCSNARPASIPRLHYCALAKTVAFPMKEKKPVGYVLAFEGKATLG